MIETNASGWSDFDQRTLDEADERVVAEIAVMEAVVRELHQLRDRCEAGPAVDASIALAEARLYALGRRRDRPGARRDSVSPG
jgi:hypothetical protein